MSFHNHAEARKIGREQNCLAPKSTPPFRTKQHNHGGGGRVSIDSNKSSGPSPPLLLVTGTQIAQKQVDANSSSCGLPRPHPRRHSSRFVVLNVNDSSRIHFPRLDDGSEDVGCSSRGDGESSGFSSMSSVSTNVPSKSSKSLRGHQRPANEDVVFHDDISTSVKQDRGLRQQDSAPPDISQLERLFIVKNVPPKIMSSTKSKPILMKRLSLLPVLSQNREPSGNVEMRRKMTRANSLPTSCPSSLKEIDPMFLPIEKDDKLQDIGVPKASNVEHQLEPQSWKGPDEHAQKRHSGLVSASFENSTSSEEVSGLLQTPDSGRLIKAFDSVWPELLNDLIKEYVTDFENMDNHMRQCMVKLLSDNTEARPL